LLLPLGPPSRSPTSVTFLGFSRIRNDNQLESRKAAIFARRLPLSCFCSPCYLFASWSVSWENSFPLFPRVSRHPRLWGAGSLFCSLATSA
jgi:hypothetical protein